MTTMTMMMVGKEDFEGQMLSPKDKMLVRSACFPKKKKAEGGRIAGS